MFGAFTYIAFTLTEVSGFAGVHRALAARSSSVSVCSSATPRRQAADRSWTARWSGSLASSTWSSLVFALTAENQVTHHRLTLPHGRLRIRDGPRPADADDELRGEAPTLASGANIGAFNVVRPRVAGGVTITAGLGYTSPIWAGAGITLLGLAVMVLAAAAAKRRDAGRDGVLAAADVAGADGERERVELQRA